PKLGIDFVRSIDGQIEAKPFGKAGERDTAADGKRLRRMRGSDTLDSKPLRDSLSKQGDHVRRSRSGPQADGHAVAHKLHCARGGERLLRIALTFVPATLLHRSAILRADGLTRSCDKTGYPLFSTERLVYLAGELWTRPPNRCHPGKPAFRCSA